MPRPLRWPTPRPPARSGEVIEALAAGSMCPRFESILSGGDPGRVTVFGESPGGFDDKFAHCATYVRTFRETDLFDSAEYEARGCSDWPPESISRF